MSQIPPRESHTRTSPYELVFGSGDFEAERLPEIRDEARARGVRAADPDALVQLQSAGALLRELMPDDAPASAVLGVGRLLFQAYHFWLFGRHVVSVDEALARRLMGSPPVVGEWELTPPHPAGYLQLPRNLVWARAEEGAPPEPVDGLFWTMVGDADPAVPPYSRLDALLALGLRPDRPGFTVVDVAASLADRPGHFADAYGRASGEGADFSNVLPGGELTGLFALITSAEVLRLLSLCFWHAAAHPAALVPLPRGQDGAEASSSSGGADYQLLREVPAGG